MGSITFIRIAEDLELAGLVWQPEIGDEVANRTNKNHVSVLVDTQALTPIELRSSYLWLPSVEQMVTQLEARQAILFHAGLDLNDHSLQYRTVIQSKFGQVESMAESFRLSVGVALRKLLLLSAPAAIN